MRDRLIKAAKIARENAYAPYSNFKVGAAVSTTSGTIYTGCNIENASFSLTCCAERTAIFHAITNGETTFNKMVVIADTEGPVSPCGSCRQVMAEFFSDEVVIYLTNLTGIIEETNVNELLPRGFRLSSK